MVLEAPIVHHIPVCPFSQRLEILLELKGRQDAVEFRVVDITRPRPPELLRRTRGRTPLPVLETPEGGLLRESLVILRYLDERFPEAPVAQRDPYRRAVEGMLTLLEGEFCARGYGWVMNQDTGRRDACREALLAVYGQLNEFLLEHAPSGPWLFNDFGWAEAVYTPLFQRFWFLEYYEAFQLPREPRYDRVRAWREACLAHPAVGQVVPEEIVRLYYDCALGVGNGALPPGRGVSSFAPQPPWSSRPWPPADKYGHRASDAELGLIAQA
ncbi:MAG: glutathione S-transferase family protein [Cyanobacteriota bacterium]|jgi:glutathione S-transferase